MPLGNEACERVAKQCGNQKLLVFRCSPVGGRFTQVDKALSFSFHKPTSFQGLGVTTYKGKLNHRVSYTIFRVTCQ